MVFTPEITEVHGEEKCQPIQNRINMIIRINMITEKWIIRSHLVNHTNHENPVLLLEKWLALICYSVCSVYSVVIREEFL